MIRGRNRRSGQRWFMDQTTRGFKLRETQKQATTLVHEKLRDE